MVKSSTEIEREIREALSGLPVEARGLWHEMRHLIEQFQTSEGGRIGHLRRNGRPLSDAQLAIMAGCAADTVARLLADLSDVGLIIRADDCWQAPRLARLAELRRQQRERVARHRATAPDQRPGRSEGGKALRNARALRNSMCNADVTRPVTAEPPPSLPFSPTTPLYPHTHPHSGNFVPGPLASPSSDRAGGGRKAADPDDFEPDPPPAAEDEDAEDDGQGVMVPVQDKPKRAAKPRPRKTTDEQQAAFSAFWDWYRDEAWPQANAGVQYEPHSADAAALWWLLRRKSIDWNVSALQALARTYLAMPAVMTRSGRPMFAIKPLFNSIRAFQAQQETRNAKPAYVQRPGQFAEPRGKLEELARRRASQHAHAGDAGAGPGGAG